MQHYVPQPQRKGPILVVDDDSSIRQVLRDVLEDEGYRVESATGGYDGLLKIPHVDPALVLLDMRMPGFDGWAFAAIVKRAHPRVPIIVMTAAKEAESWADTIQAQGYIGKPFDVADLIAVVERFTA